MNLYDSIVVSVPRSTDPNLRSDLAHGTVSVSCDYCGHDCLMGPAMQSYLTGCRTEIKIICMDCNDLSKDLL